MAGTEPQDQEGHASLVRALKELERFFRRAEDLLFKQKMPLPVITIQTKGKRKALGWFSQDRWHSEKSGHLPEINIAAEYLDMGVAEVAQVQLHEMVHYSNFLRNIKDFSSNQYHNQFFKARCDQIRLVCEYGAKGWAYTKLSPELQVFVQEAQLNADAFRIARGNFKLVPGKGIPAPRLLRYGCGCLNPKPVYASRGLQARCDLCRQAYRESLL